MDPKVDTIPDSESEHSFFFSDADGSFDDSIYQQAQTPFWHSSLQSPWENEERLQREVERLTTAHSDHHSSPSAPGGANGATSEPGLSTGANANADPLETHNIIRIAELTLEVASLKEQAHKSERKYDRVKGQRDELRSTNEALLKVINDFIRRHPSSEDDKSFEASSEISISASPAAFLASASPSYPHAHQETRVMVEIPQGDRNGVSAPRAKKRGLAGSSPLKANVAKRPRGNENIPM